MESERDGFYRPSVVNSVLVCRHRVSLRPELARHSLASRNLLVVRVHFSDISYRAYGIGLFQHGTLIGIRVHAIPMPLFRRQE
jgi:hypothetical protein